MLKVCHQEELEECLPWLLLVRDLQQCVKNSPGPRFSVNVGVAFILSLFFFVKKTENY